MGEAQAADLMSFCASEFHQFFGHLGNSIHTFKTTGKVPPSVFKASSNATAAAKADKPKTKRRPTAFNMFVKQKMEELKQAGVILDGDKNNNGMFTLAVREWKKLSDEGRAEFTAKFKADLQEAEGEVDEADLGVDITDIPAPAVPAVASGDVEKVKKKRKKTEHGDGASGSKDAAPPAQAKAAAAPASAPAAAPAAAKTAVEAPEGSEKKKHKSHKKDKPHKKDKSHKKETVE